ncbi:MAG: phage virion morphogenesis protein [Ghiorsea sp.]|nr:phage virion morphogenesis protein [Ghiorsea sp.]
MITIEVNDDEVQAALKRMIQAGQDFKPVFESIGEVMVHSTKKRFADGKAPDGSKWQENTDFTLSRKTGADPLVGESKALSTGIYYDASSDALLIGSPQEYAAVQQFGAAQHEFGKAPWGDIPARPFLGISDSDRNAIEQLVQAHLMRGA